VLDYSVKRLLESLGERVIQLGKRVQASLRTSNCDRETGEKLDSLEGLLAALDRQLKEDGPFLAMSLSSFEIIKCIDNIEGVALDLNTLCAVDKAQTRDASLLLVCYQDTLTQAAYC
jgi:tRNA1(Val) A37 N6-methylase TrmN6